MKRIIGLIIINIGLMAALGISTPYFLTKDNLTIIVDNMALEVIAMSGYTLLLIGGYFDLSLDGIVAICGVTAGMLMVSMGMVWYLAVLLAILVAILVGFVNGFVVVRLRVNPFIATLTTWWICVGTSLGITKALSPYGFPEAFQLLGQSRFLGFRSFVFYAIIIVVIVYILLNHTKVGAHIYASGGNRRSAELSGIEVNKIGIAMYVLMAILAGLIGLMIASRLNASSPQAVDGMALRIIAAMVIGGANLSGGGGSIVGGLLGLLLMHILSNAIIQLGISPYWQKVLLGSVLLVAVLIERINFKMRSRDV